MADHDHYTDCHRHHFACALLKIWDLEKENLALRTQLQRERTGHLTEGYPPLNVGHWEGVPTFTSKEPLGAPCHDHIEPPIVSGGPTWAHRSDDPPSLTP